METPMDANTVNTAINGAANTAVSDVKTVADAASTKVNAEIQANGNAVVDFLKKNMWFFLGGLLLLVVARFGLHVI